ncbi:MAG: Uma2 family endonuclease, partial [Cyanobacteria bacterium P01_H01_bin.58]
APDIAIEIVLTSGGIDKLDVYKGLGVREVWFWENQTFSLYGLINPNSGYETLTASRLLPQLDLTILAQFIDNPNQTQAVKAYRRTLQKQLQASS